MKKLFLSMVVALMAVSASAQVYVGGGVGIGSSKVDADGAESVTTYKFVPEVGCNLNDDWAVGVTFGWQGSNKGGEKAMGIAPYARYTFIHSKIVDVFVDGTLGYEHLYGGENIDTDVFTVGFKPGLAVKLTDHLNFVTHVGFIGYEHDKIHDTKVNSFGLDLDGTNILFGINYKF